MSWQTVESVTAHGVGITKHVSTASGLIVYIARVKSPLVEGYFTLVGPSLSIIITNALLHRPPRI